MKDSKNKIIYDFDELIPELKEWNNGKGIGVIFIGNVIKNVGH